MKSFRTVLTYVSLLYFCLNPLVASAQMSFEEQRTIAERVSAALKYVAVDAVPSPAIVGLPPVAIFWIHNDTYMFKEGDYTFGITDPRGQGVGPYLCDVVAETDHQFPRLEWKFLRNVRVEGVGVSRGDVRVGADVEGLELVMREIFAAVRFVGDWVLNSEDARFYILIRGHADAGAGFNRALLPHPYNFNEVEALPPNNQDPTGLNLYDRFELGYPITNPYSNDQLPELRARFLQKLVDAFKVTCGKAEFETRVLKGTAVPQSATPSLRRVDIFLYAYYPN